MKRNISKCLILFLLLLISKLTYCQNSKVGNWMIYFGNLNLNKRWNIHHEVQLRNYNFVGDLNQLLVRFGVGYNTSENSNFMLGYANVKTENYNINTDNKSSSYENRIFQQFLNKHKRFGFQITNRIRIEERFLNNDVKYRFRYFFQINKSLNKKDLIKNAFYISCYDEIFLNHKNKLFDRNRFYTGVGYFISNKVRLETGYMIQSLIDKNQHQYQFILHNNFSFK